MAASDYEYTTVWDSRDNIFVTRVREFPSLAAHGSSQQESLAEAQKLVADVVADLIAEKEEVPMSLRETKPL
jgi:predicted RNase H-like HicB family nuclease